MALPLGLLPKTLVYVLFIVPCFYSFLNMQKLSKESLYFCLPLVLMSFAILVSHLKSIYLRFPMSLHDISDYFKFILPCFLFISLSNLVKKNGYQKIISVLKYTIILYLLLFLLYTIFGSKIIFDLGLGRRDPWAYRYGGLDIYPNSYASIVVALGILSFIVFESKTAKILASSILFLSLLASQSRTNLIAFAVYVILSLFLIQKRVFLKCIITFGLILISILVLRYADLPYLQNENRFDFETDRSLNTRIDNSLTQVNLYRNSSGLFGIGPARALLDRLDTVPYLMYLIRYGWIGFSIFISIHIIIYLRFVYNLYFLTRGYKKSANKENEISLFLGFAGTFPIFVLISNFSEEKWIDLKFLFLFVLITVLGMHHIKLSKPSIA